MSTRKSVSKNRKWNVGAVKIGIVTKIDIVIKIRLTLRRWKGTWDSSTFSTERFIFRVFYF